MLKLGRQGDIDVFYLALVNVRSDVGVLLRPCLDDFDGERITHVHEFLFFAPRRCRHCENQRIFAGLHVFVGDEDIGVVSDGAVALIDYEEGHVL